MSTKYIFIKIYKEGGFCMIKITLDKTMKKLNVTRYELSKRTGINYPIIDRYYKNKVVRYDSYILNKLCIALDCAIEDIIKFEKE